MHGLKNKLSPSRHPPRKKLERKGVKKSNLEKRNSKISSKGQGKHMQVGCDCIAERQG